MPGQDSSPEEQLADAQAAEREAKPTVGAPIPGEAAAYARILTALTDETAKLDTPAGEALSRERHEAQARPKAIANLAAAARDLRAILAADQPAPLGLEPAERERLHSAGKLLHRLAAALSKVEERHVRFISDPAEPDLSQGGMRTVSIWPAGFEDLDPSAILQAAAYTLTIAEGRPAPPPPPAAEPSADGLVVDDREVVWRDGDPA